MLPVFGKAPAALGVSKARLAVIDGEQHDEPAATLPMLIAESLGDGRDKRLRRAEGQTRSLVAMLEEGRAC